MFDIGFLELVLIAVLALLVLGPERLPHAARTAGKWVGKAKRMVSQVTQEIDKQIKADELREKIRQEGDDIGVEEIQKTVKDALDKANDFKSEVSQNIDHPEKLNIKSSSEP